MKKFLGKIKNIKGPKKFNKVAIVATVLVFSIIGYIVLRQSLAADSVVDVQGESLTVAGGAGTGSDSNASSGQYFKFASETPPPPPPSGGTDPIPPTYSGTCPTFTNGTLTFNDGTGNRSVLVRMDSNASTNNGPLVFLWHGQQPPSNLNQIFTNLLGDATTNDIANKGGIVVAPTMYQAGTWGNADNWNTSNRDLTLVDTIVACAVKQNLIDVKRIHSVGMSWGGFQTSHLAYLRSNYIASAVVMSGGFTGSAPSNTIQRPSNKFATITTLGSTSAGELKTVVSPLEGYRDFAKSNGQFVVFCQHSGGHIPIANGGPMHQRFFQDHPYGVAKAYSTLPSPPFLSSCSVY